MSKITATEFSVQPSEDIKIIGVTLNIVSHSKTVLTTYAVTQCMHYVRHLHHIRAGWRVDTAISIAGSIVDSRSTYAASALVYVGQRLAQAATHSKRCCAHNTCLLMFQCDLPIVIPTTVPDLLPHSLSCHSSHWPSAYRPMYLSCIAYLFSYCTGRCVHTFPQNKRIYSSLCKFHDIDKAFSIAFAPV